MHDSTFLYFISLNEIIFSTVNLCFTINMCILYGLYMRLCLGELEKLIKEIQLSLLETDLVTIILHEMDKVGGMLLCMREFTI